MIVKDYQSFFGYDMINTVITALQLSNCPVRRTNWGYTSYTVMWQNQSPQLSHDKIKLTVLTTVTLSGDKITLNVLTTVEWQEHTFLTTVTLLGDKFILSLQLSHDKIILTLLTAAAGEPWWTFTYPRDMVTWLVILTPAHLHTVFAIKSSHAGWNTIQLFKTLFQSVSNFVQAQGIKGWNAIEKMDNS